MDTQNQAWSKDTSNFGFRMLQKMGWGEGKGLGKNEDGMSAHIKMKKRGEHVGALEARLQHVRSPSLLPAASHWYLLSFNLPPSQLSAPKWTLRATACSQLP